MASAQFIPVEPPFDPVQARPGSRWEGVGFHAQVRAAPAAGSRLLEVGREPAIGTGLNYAAGSGQ
jgi:hypothetical protein